MLCIWCGADIIAMHISRPTKTKGACTFQTVLLCNDHFFLTQAEVKMLRSCAVPPAQYRSPICHKGEIDELIRDLLANDSY